MIHHGGAEGDEGEGKKFCWSEGQLESRPSSPRESCGNFQMGYSPFKIAATLSFLSLNLIPLRGESNPSGEERYYLMAGVISLHVIRAEFFRHQFLDFLDGLCLVCGTD
jgi:hypothetical protein